VKRRISWDFLITRYPAFFPLILLVISIAINLFLQPNMFERETLNSNMRVFLPLILLAVGQAIVLLGGGIDISVGGIVSIVNTILATRVGLDGSPQLMWQFVIISLLAGVLAGAINGFFIAYLRLQPIITTYATSFLYAGFALFILPNPGGGIPADIADLYRSSTPLGLPLAFYVIAILLLIWIYVSVTRYGKFLFAVGGKADAAYETAVPVTTMQFSIYVI
jgi:ribose transport system permease protein